MLDGFKDDDAFLVATVQAGGKTMTMVRLCGERQQRCVSARATTVELQMARLASSHAYHMHVHVSIDVHTCRRLEKPSVLFAQTHIADLLNYRYTEEPKQSARCKMPVPRSNPFVRGGLTGESVKAEALMISKKFVTLVGPTLTNITTQDSLHAFP